MSELVVDDVLDDPRSSGERNRAARLLREAADGASLGAVDKKQAASPSPQRVWNRAPCEGKLCESRFAVESLVDEDGDTVDLRDRAGHGLEPGSHLTEGVAEAGVAGKETAGHALGLPVVLERPDRTRR
jgi:hypothetical protein